MERGTHSLTLIPWGHLTHVPTNGVSSIVLLRCSVGAALLSAAAGEKRDQFSLVLQPMRAGINSVQPNPLAFGGNRSSGYQQTHRLQSGHGPRHGPWQKLRPRYHHGPGWQAGCPPQPVPHHFRLFRSALSTGYEPFSFFPIPHDAFAHRDSYQPCFLLSTLGAGCPAHACMSSCPAQLLWCWAGPCFLLPPGADSR